MEDAIDRTVRFACATGHDIPATDLDRLSEVQRLDEGAEVRVCREHGCPVMITVIPRREPEP